MNKLLLATSVLALTAAMPLAANAITLNVGIGASANGSGGLSVGNTGVNLGANTSANATASLGGSASTGGGTSDGSATANGSASGSSAAMVAANTSINSVVDAFASNQAELNAIANLQDDSVVDVIRIGTVASANADTFASVASENADATAQLQAAINANADFKAQLEGSDVSVDSIVAADVTADGALVLYSNSNG